MTKPMTKTEANELLNDCLAKLDAAIMRSTPAIVIRKLRNNVKAARRIVRAAK